MADKRCDNGHFIDESWDLCPYCPAEAGEPEMPIVRPSRVAAAPEPLRIVPQPVVPMTMSPEPLVASPTPVAAPPPAVPRREPQAIQIPPMERTVAAQKIDPTAPPVRYVVGWLVGLTGSSRGESFPVRIGRNMLGRDRRSDIVVNDDQASAHHADLVFRPEERRFILMDHNSTNGTYVNEMEIEPRGNLSGRDVIRIGSQKFVFLPLVDEQFFWDSEGALK